MKKISHTRKLTLGVLVLSMALTGCGSVGRLKNVGKAPDLKPIENPTQTKDYQRVSMPMPSPEAVVYQPNSLWRAGTRTFFNDQRAAKIGDILTVNIDITDNASVDNTTARSRNSSESSNIAKLLGFESRLDRILPDAVDPTNLTDLGSVSSSQGTGTVDRSETIDLTVAAVITQKLPNGNLVIRGSQEVRVNYEVRELFVTGIVRPEDISNQNTISHTQIAEARISYGGRGHISDMQQPRYGQQVMDIIMPF